MLDLPATPDSADALTPVAVLELADQLDSKSADAQRQSRVELLLERYLGSAIAGSILDNDPLPQRSHFVEATVLFADIRDFTALAEETALSLIHEELNEYYSMIIGVIRDNGGEVNKFGGDSVLALFGAPLPLKDHAQSAVIAASNIMEELDALNTRRQSQGRPPFRVGIGVNTGEMLIGSFGSEQRLEYTVIGDCVNAAQRLSDLSKDTPFYSIFIGERTKEALYDLPDWEIEPLGPKPVRGRQKPIVTYAVTPLDIPATDL
jgi:adenylate cyclase